MTAPPPVPAETPGETPAALLRRAAARVRELAKEATQGPWVEWDEDVQGEVRADDGDAYLLSDASCKPPDLAWIALVSPHIAEPLAAWLDDAAEYEDGADKLDAIGDGCSRWDGASRDLPLALALALLGSPVPVPDGEGAA